MNWRLFQPEATHASCPPAAQWMQQLPRLAQECAVCVTTKVWSRCGYDSRDEHDRSSHDIEKCFSRRRTGGSGKAVRGYMNPR